VIGWFVGAVAGWLLAAAVGRRAGQQGPGVQLSMQVSAMFGLVLLARRPAARDALDLAARRSEDKTHSW
jgi:hypothetical protein